jgi:hypothetical protein
VVFAAGEAVGLDLGEAVVFGDAAALGLGAGEGEFLGAANAVTGALNASVATAAIMIWNFGFIRFGVVIEPSFLPGLGEKSKRGWG